MNVLVTGGARGIGAGIVRALAEQGHNIGFCGRGAEAVAADFLTELRSRFSGTFQYYSCDISRTADRTALIDRGFALALQRLEGQLRGCRAAVLHQELVREATGCEALYAVDLPPRQLKALCVALEEADDFRELTWINHRSQEIVKKWQNDDLPPWRQQEDTP